RLLSDDLTESLAEAVVATPGVQDTELAKLRGGDVLVDAACGLEDRLAEGGDGPHRPPDLPQPGAARILHRAVITQVVQARLEQDVAVGPRARPRPRDGSPQALPQRVAEVRRLGAFDRLDP